MSKDLRTIDWQIYNILKTQNDWITQKDLCGMLLTTIAIKDNVDNLKERETIMNMSNDEFHNTQWRHIITRSIRDLNNASVIQKIILSTGKGIKIASEEEWEKYVERQTNAVIRKFARIRKIVKKGSLNNQYRITFGERQRNIIEAFLSENAE